MGEHDELAEQMFSLFTAYLVAGFAHYDALELVKAHIIAGHQVASKEEGMK